MLAGAIGHPGEVMVLDMGEPVYIYDVAHEMRKAYERYDVDIVVTGLRPGEKLDEPSLVLMSNTLEALKTSLFLTRRHQLSTLRIWIMISGFRIMKRIVLMSVMDLPA